MTLTTHRDPPVSGGAFGAAPSFDIDLFVSRYGGSTGLKFKANAVLYAQGEPADCLFYIQDGQVQLTVVSAQGKEAIWDVLRQGDFCGQGCLAGEQLRVSTATCKTDCVVARLEKASVIRAIQQDPLFAEFYVTSILNRTVRIRDSLISQLFDTSEQRLARILLLLANYGKEGRHDHVIGRLDQEALAQMVGTTRSRINHFMNKFRRLGYIDYDGDIAVHSSLLNVALHGHADDAAENRKLPG